ncbi:dipeptidyl peptidase 3 [Psychrobacillus psychrodurans]|uniref:dipeptidyl peptidase 3 n=1 Tax=Psychrobacillus psychrodurans TaxID=126157 RepID=UPI001F4EF0AF|nr:dipeptidyl peptidase 3 [Psychrobacillus psychrodurans]MCK1999407.1 dipeptidyl peptidase 3 [Psychrobacillus psychrodurans]
MSKRKNKSVSFNLENERDKKNHDHATRINPLTGKPINFSDYVKELIEDDRKRKESGGGRIVQQVIEETIVRKEKDAYTLEAMNGFL